MVWEFRPAVVRLTAAVMNSTQSGTTVAPTRMTNATLAISSTLASASVTISSTISATVASTMETVASTVDTIASTLASTAVARTEANISATTPGPHSACDSFDVNLPDNIGLSVVCGVAFMLGIFFAFFGYRVFRATCFTQSLALFGTVTHIVLLRTTSLSMAINGVVSAGAGCILGAASAFLLPVGIVTLSLGQSVFFTSSIIIVLNLFHASTTIWIPIGVMTGLFILFVVLCFFWQRIGMILYSTSFSAILIMTSVDYFISKFDLTTHAFNKLKASASTLDCWYPYLLFVLWPVVMVLGCLIQQLKTAKGFHHRGEEDSPTLKKKSPSLHRGLYYNGDIIAQAWIQDAEDTLEKRASYMQPFEDCYPEPGESTTLV